MPEQNEREKILKKRSGNSFFTQHNTQQLYCVIQIRQPALGPAQPAARQPATQTGGGALFASTGIPSSKELL